MLLRSLLRPRLAALLVFPRMFALGGFAGPQLLSQIGVAEAEYVSENCVRAKLSSHVEAQQKVLVLIRSHRTVKVTHPACWAGC